MTWAETRERASAALEAVKSAADGAKEQTCRGFVPRHGFGRAHDCATCGKHLAEHPVVEQ